MIGRAQDLFIAASRKSRIFRRMDHIVTICWSCRFWLEAAPRACPANDSTIATGVAELLNKLLLKKYAPAAVLMTRRYEVLSMQGPLVKFLDFPPGSDTRLACHGSTSTDSQNPNRCPRGDSFRAGNFERTKSPLSRIPTSYDANFTGCPCRRYAGSRRPADGDI